MHWTKFKHFLSIQSFDIDKTHNKCSKKSEQDVYVPRVAFIGFGRVEFPKLNVAAPWPVLKVQLMGENVRNKRRLGNNFSSDKLPEGSFTSALVQ